MILTFKNLVWSLYIHLGPGSRGVTENIRFEMRRSLVITYEIVVQFVQQKKPVHGTIRKLTNVPCAKRIFFMDF